MKSKKQKKREKMATFLSNRLEYSEEYIDDLLREFEEKKEVRK